LRSSPDVRSGTADWYCRTSYRPLYQRYVQLSYHWNPANDSNGKFDTVVINRPSDNGLRMVHPNE
jgi:hypothetical protein